MTVQIVPDLLYDWRAAACRGEFPNGDAERIVGPLQHMERRIKSGAEQTHSGSLSEDDVRGDPALFQDRDKHVQISMAETQQSRTISTSRRTQFIQIRLDRLKQRAFFSLPEKCRPLLLREHGKIFCAGSVSGFFLFRFFFKCMQAVFDRNPVYCTPDSIFDIGYGGHFQDIFHTVQLYCLAGERKGIVIRKKDVFRAIPVFPHPAQQIQACSARRFNIAYHDVGRTVFNKIGLCLCNGVDRCKIIKTERFPVDCA